MDRSLDENPGAGDADLSAIGVDAHRGAGHGLVEVRVGKDDIGRLPAEFGWTRLMLPADARMMLWAVT